MGETAVWGVAWGLLTDFIYTYEVRGQFLVRKHQYKMYESSGTCTRGREKPPSQYYRVLPAWGLWLGGLVFCVAFGFGCSAFSAVSFALFAGSRSVLVSSCRVVVVSFVLNVGSRLVLV